MTLARYSDGSKRELPTIKVAVSCGQLLATLQDHASRSQVSAYSATWEGLLDALEAACAHEDGWREYDSPIVKESTLRGMAKKQS